MPDLTMSVHGRQLLRSISRTLLLLEEHAKTHPHEVEIAYRALVAHVRSARPQLLGGAL